MCDGSYLTSAVAPQVSCGGIWPFGDLATGAHQLALVLVPCQAAAPALTDLRPPDVTIFSRSTSQQQRLAYSFIAFTNTSFDAQNIVSELLPSPKACHGAPAKQFHPHPDAS
jgi:hypothetical protein